MLDYIDEVLTFLWCVEICMTSVYIQGFLYILHKAAVYTVHSVYEYGGDCLLALDCGSDISVYSALIEAAFLCVYLFNHTAGRCHIRHTVDQDKLTKCLVVFELIADYLVGECDLYDCYLVLFELVGRLFLTCVYIDGMLYFCHDARY